MANTYYVSKSGNDGNPGTSGSPRLTIQGGVALMANGDTLVVRAGTYNESVTLPTINSASFYLKAEGRVVIDGQNLRANCIVAPNNTGQTFTLTGFELARAITALIAVTGSALPTFHLYNCILRDAPQVSGSNAVRPGVFQFNLFRNLTSAVGPQIYSLSGSSQFLDNVFDLIPATSGVIYCGVSDNPPVLCQRNVFSRCAVFINLANSGALPTNLIFDYNSYDFSYPGKCMKAATNYTTFANWQAAASPILEQHGKDQVPQFCDLANGMYAPLPAGNLASMGPQSSYMGPQRIAYALSGNVNKATWEGGTHNNTQFSGDVLEQATAGTPGIYTLPTIDLGASVKLWSIRPSLVGEVYPTDVCDSSILDTNPNYHTLEYRTSTVSQADCEAQAWSTVKIDYLGNQAFASTIIARWLQVRITLRDNGVAA